MVAAALPIAANDASPAPDAAAGSWAWFERQPEKVRAEAKRRQGALVAIEQLVQAGERRTVATEKVAATLDVTARSLWNWADVVKGVPASDWLPVLAPRRRGGGVQADVDPAVWRALKSDYLRPEKPSWKSVYNRWKPIADERGVPLPSSQTLWRRLQQDVGRELRTFRRDGRDAHRQLLPPQKRTVAHLHAMEVVNIDGHLWDVFVRWPDGSIARPLMVAIQDVHSRKLLAWRIGETESAVLTRLAFGDLFARFGIPKACVLDNGRAFASKWITGGAKSRFRFRIRDEEPLGLLPALGVEVHWATPYRGSSKPIERAFRDLCDTAAKHPAFAGAYTGNAPDAKPENYGNAAVPLAEFVAIVEQEIDRHNAQPGRETEVCKGVLSFDDAFARSCAAGAPIGRATEEHLRLALLTADEVRCDRRSGAIERFYGNRYWSPELSSLAGERVAVRFDPDDLTKPLHVYTREGRYVCSAPMMEATGFLDVASARSRARLERDHRKAVRQAIDAQELLDAADLAAMLPRPIAAETPEPSVIRPVRRRHSNAALKPAAEAVAEPDQPTLADRMAAGVRIAAARHLRSVN